MIIVKRGSVERIIEEGKLDSFIKEGFVVLNNEITENKKEVKNIKKLNLSALKELAKEKGISGYESLTKDELITLISKYE